MTLDLNTRLRLQRFDDAQRAIQVATRHLERSIAGNADEERHVECAYEVLQSILDLLEDEGLLCEAAKLHRELGRE